MLKTLRSVLKNAQFCKEPDQEGVRLQIHLQGKFKKFNSPRTLMNLLQNITLNCRI